MTRTHATKQRRPRSNGDGAQPQGTEAPETMNNNSTGITATTTNDEIYDMVSEYAACTGCGGAEGDAYLEYLFDARTAAREARKAANLAAVNAAFFGPDAAPIVLVDVLAK